MVVTVLIAFLVGLIVFGWVLSVLTAKTLAHKVAASISIAAIAVVWFMPTANKIHNYFSRQRFMKTANGQINLKYSPMHFNPSKVKKNYCNQFKDQNGNVISVVLYDSNNEAYCGVYPGFEKGNVLLPYKLLPNNRAIYWSSYDFQIIGPHPKDYR